MPTVINNPGTTEDTGSNLVLAIVLIVVVIAGVALFFVYGLPMLRNNSNQTPSSTNINVTVPATPTTPATPAPTTNP